MHCYLQFGTFIPAHCHLLLGRYLLKCLNKALNIYVLLKKCGSSQMIATNRAALLA